MPKPPKTLWFISNVSPAAGHGGQIVVERHLRRLIAGGWRVCVASHIAARPDISWKQRQIPMRRIWWPPFRPASGLLMRLRSWAWLRELRSLPPPNVVATVCWGPLSWLAVDAAERFQCPLAAIVHDHWRETRSDEGIRIGERVGRRADVLFAVSEEMRFALANDFGSEKTVVLAPLPAARQRPFVDWQARFAHPIVAHVGSLHNYHVDYLQRVSAALAPLGGQVLLLSARDNPIAAELLRRAPNILQQNTFPRNEQALDFVAQHASALTVMYPRGSEPGAKPLGFPSRLVEFSQLGLPILTAAPAGNPLSNWAARHNWPAALHPFDDSRLRILCAGLAKEHFWKSSACCTRTLAETEFDPDRIHSLFESQISRFADIGHYAAARILSP